MSIKYKSNKTFASFILLFIIFVSIINPPIIANAYVTYYIQMTIDTDNWIFLGGVIKDNGSQASDSKGLLEPKRISKNELDKMASNSESNSGATNLINNLSLDEERIPQASLTDQNLVLSFPGEKTGSLWWKNSADTDDMNRAIMVKDSLLYDLNSALKLVYGDKTYTDLSDFRNDVISLLKGGIVNGWDISYENGPNSDYKFPDKSINSSDYVKISKDGKDNYFLFRMPKGYININDRTMPKNLDSHIINDTSFINWGMLAYEAFANAVMDGNLIVSSENVYNSTPGSLEKSLVELFNNLLDYISGALGLWNLDELIFNNGIRGGISYIGGVFPSSWEIILWTLFFVSEIISISLMLYSIIQNVIKKAMSTVNSSIRADAINQLQDIIIVIILLCLLPVLMSLTINMSKSLTDIFASISGDKTVSEHFSFLGASSGSIGGIIMQFFYFGALIYFNFFYTLRSLIVFVLIILSPIFISFLAMGENKKQLALSAIQEFCANVFIQPIHGLLLSVIVILPFTGRAVESLVLIYSLIPATTLVRSLFFGNGGGLIHRTANIMKNSSMAIGAGLAIGAGAGTLHGAGQILNAGFKNIPKNSSGTNRGNPKTSESSSPSNSSSDYSADTGIKEKRNIPEDAAPSTPETKKDYFIKNLKNTAPVSRIINTADTTAKRIKSSAIGHTIQNVSDKFEDTKQSIKETPVVQTVGNFMKNTSDKFNSKVNNFKETPLAKSISENIPDVLDKTKNIAKDSLKLAAIPASAAGGVILSGIGGGLKTASFGNIGRGVSKAGDMMASYSGKKMSDIALSGKNKWDNLFKAPEDKSSLNNISDTKHKDTTPDYLKPKTSMDISELATQHTFDKNTFSKAGMSNFKIGKNGYVSYNIDSRKASDKDNENLSYYSELYEGNIYPKDSKQYKTAVAEARENGVQYASQEISNGKPTGIYHLELNKNANKEMSGYYRQSKEEREDGLISFIQNKNNTTDYMGVPRTIQKPDIINNKADSIPEVDDTTSNIAETDNPIPDNKDNNIDNNASKIPTLNDKTIDNNLIPSPSIPKPEDNTTDAIIKDKTIDNSNVKTKKPSPCKRKNNTIKNKKQNSNNNTNIPSEYTDIIDETLNNK